MRVLAAAATVLTVAAAAIVPAVLAQEPSREPFAKDTRLDCAFTVTVAGTWVNGAPRAEVTRGAVVRFQIVDIDAAAGSARVTLGAASEDVTARAAGGKLHVIDLRSSGSLAITTVFGEAGATRFRAVHALSDYHAYDRPGFSAIPQTEQSSGFCSIIQ